MRFMVMMKVRSSIYSHRDRSQIICLWQISATPSQLGGVTATQVSDSQTADLQFSPPTSRSGSEAAQGIAN